MVTPDIGTKGTTSVAPMRGCSPVWLLRSISPAAFFTPARAASTTTGGGATKVTTDRLWSGSDSRSSRTAPFTDLMAPTISSITSARRPSLKLGMHSTIRCISAERRRFLPQILRVQSVVEPPDHHLFPGLLTPSNLTARIGIELVVHRVVVMSGAFDFAALGSGDGLLQDIGGLPVEIVPGNVQDDF